MSAPSRFSGPNPYVLIAFYRHVGDTVRAGHAFTEWHDEPTLMTHEMMEGRPIRQELHEPHVWCFFVMAVSLFAMAESIKFGVSPLASSRISPSPRRYANSSEITPL